MCIANTIWASVPVSNETRFTGLENMKHIACSGGCDIMISGETVDSPCNDLTLPQPLASDRSSLLSPASQTKAFILKIYEIFKNPVREPDAVCSPPSLSSPHPGLAPSEAPPERA